MNPSPATWDADAKQVEALRHLGVPGRLKMAFSMYDFARQVTLNAVRAKHSDWKSDQVEAEVRRRMGTAR